jgi:2'-5' RNA ligase
LTLARFREPEKLVDSVLSEVAGRHFGDTAVREVVIYQSLLSRGPAAYRPLRRVPFGGASRDFGR